jgi:tRNA-2-methylthio-N6-dimethylallyladenosine synthase
MIARIARGEGAVLNTEFPVEPKFDFLPEARGTSRVSAFLSIQEGCDKFCTFCVVPYTRGAEYSRGVDALVAEGERLVEAGAREISLLGQNVNAFHGQGPDGKIWGLGRLLRRMAEIPNLKRLRYTTSHPRDMDDELIEAHRDLPQLMPLMHLPVQSGSDRMLDVMNRKHTADDYRRIIGRMRDARPDIVFSSDFIVGFPGETDEDFAATMQLVRDVQFAQSFSFAYSRRPGTPAATMTNQIDEAVKATRLKELQALLRQQQEAFNRDAVGKVLPVLFENITQDGGLFGRTPFMQAVRVNAPARAVAQEFMVKVTSAGHNSLTGEIALDQV